MTLRILDIAEQLDVEESDVVDFADAIGVEHDEEELTVGDDELDRFVQLTGMVVE